MDTKIIEEIKEIKNSYGKIFEFKYVYSKFKIFKKEFTSIKKNNSKTKIGFRKTKDKIIIYLYDEKIEIKQLDEISNCFVYPDFLIEYFAKIKKEEFRCKPSSSFLFVYFLLKPYSLNLDYKLFKKFLFKKRIIELENLIINFNLYQLTTGKLISQKGQKNLTKIYNSRMSERKLRKVRKANPNVDNILKILTYNKREVYYLGENYKIFKDIDHNQVYITKNNFKNIAFKNKKKIANFLSKNESFVFKTKNNKKYYLLSFDKTKNELLILSEDLKSKKIKNFNDIKTLADIYNFYHFKDFIILKFQPDYNSEYYLIFSFKNNKHFFIKRNYSFYFEPKNAFKGNAIISEKINDLFKINQDTKKSKEKVFVKDQIIELKSDIAFQTLYHQKEKIMDGVKLFNKVEIFKNNSEELIGEFNMYINKGFCYFFNSKKIKNFDKNKPQKYFEEIKTQHQELLLLSYL